MTTASEPSGIDFGSAQELWAAVKEVWTTSFLGLDVGDLLIALTVMAVAILIRGLFSRLIKIVLRRQTERTATLIDDKVLEAVSGPLKLIPIIIGVYVAVNVLDLNDTDGIDIGGNLVLTLIIVAIFWALHNAVAPVSYLLTGLRNLLTPVLVDWFARALRILFIIVGIGAVLETWGIPVAPIVAGLGLLGVAVGLGAQDLFRNLIAGLLILTEKRFLPGEWILVDGVVEGHVEQINFRSTLVRRFDKSPVYVPNAFLADNAVTNFTRMTHRRIKWYIGVEYKTSVDQLKYIRDHVLDYVLTEEAFAKPPEVTTFMRVDAFGASSIDFMLYAFTKTTNWTEWLEIKEKLAFRIKQIVEDEAGTAFAFPSTTVYMDDGSEVFEPPRVKQHAGKADPAQIEELAKSIQAEGLLQPIVVRAKKDKFELIAGERRLRAYESLGQKAIPARIIEASDASSAALALIENLQRENLNPIEESLGYASLMGDFDLTQEGVAERVGKARATIANSLRLLQLDREIQGYLARGLISSGHAKVLLGIEDEAQRILEHLCPELRQIFERRSATVVYATTDRSDFDTQLSLWHGTAHPLTEVACSEDEATDMARSCVFCAIAVMASAVSCNTLVEFETAFMLDETWSSNFLTRASIRT